MFTEKKLTEKMLLPGSRKYGFLLYTLSHTHHLICLGCHKVVDIDGCPLHGFEEDLARKTHFEIVGTTWNCTATVPTARPNGKRNSVPNKKRRGCEIIPTLKEKWLASSKKFSSHFVVRYSRI